MERAGFISLWSLLVQTVQLTGLLRWEQWGSGGAVTAGQADYLSTGRLILAAEMLLFSLATCALSCVELLYYQVLFFSPGLPLASHPSLTVFASVPRKQGGRVVRKERLPSIDSILGPDPAPVRGEWGPARGDLDTVSAIHTLSCPRLSLQFTSVNAPLIFIKGNFLFKRPRHLGSTVMEIGVCLPPEGSRGAGPHCHPRRVAVKIVAL